MLQSLGKMFVEIPFNRMLGLNLDNLVEDKVTLSFPMKNELIGNFMQGILHGGVISSVIDMSGGLVAMAAAAHKHKEKSLDEIKILLGKSSTVALNINYIRPGKGNFFFVNSRVLRSGNKICFTQSELFNEEDVLIAAGAATYLVG